ncbi:unnamed protein product [Nyctereutes procyonoides]|uniref:(raccoon dog) hypothetical protein n=1 Tax=Nyctereutes procyonoides TaxID=34880 RepID=A0A811YT20_NYCPR|nr:unnamed protein product [Nyctereutes procyonoides]
MDNLSSEEIQLRAHQDTGIKIITMLDEQGELNRIEGMNQIKITREAEKTLMELYKATWVDGGDNSSIIEYISSQPSDNQPQQPTSGAAGEDEMEENLTQMGSILGNLKNMADTNKYCLDVANARAKETH